MKEFLEEVEPTVAAADGKEDDLLQHFQKMMLAGIARGYKWWNIWNGSQRCQETMMGIVPNNN